MLSKTKALALTSLLLLSTSCRSLESRDDDDFGLKLVSLTMTPEEYGLLNGQLLSKRPAEAKIKVAGEFTVQCQVHYAGRSSLDSYRKSFDLEFCDQKYNKRSKYRLTAQSIDRTLTRSLIGYDIFKALDVEIPKAEPAVLYINHEYKGLYVFMETIEKEFFKAHKISVAEIYKARFGNASFKKEFASRIPEAFSYEGKGEDDFTFIERIYNLLWLEADDAVFAQSLESMMDVDNYLSYIAAALFIDHWDGFDNNYFLAYHLDAKRLVTVPWDLDRIWEKVDEMTPEQLLSRNELLTRLLKIPTYKKALVSKVAQLAKDFPADKLIKSMHKKAEKAREAYHHDPILVRFEDTAFSDFEQKVTKWDGEIRAFLERNPI